MQHLEKYFISSKQFCASMDLYYNTLILQKYCEVCGCFCTAAFLTLPVIQLSAFTALEKGLHLRIDCVHTEFRNFIDEYIRCCRVAAEQCVYAWC